MTSQGNRQARCKIAHHLEHGAIRSLMGNDNYEVYRIMPMLMTSSDR